MLVGILGGEDVHHDLLLPGYVLKRIEITLIVVLLDVVDDWNIGVIPDGYNVWCDTHERAMLPMQLYCCLMCLTIPDIIDPPELGICRKSRPWYANKMELELVAKQVEDDQRSDNMQGICKSEILNPREVRCIIKPYLVGHVVSQNLGEDIEQIMETNTR